ncbi:MAG: response regulator [Nonlabens sp.]
MSYKSEKSIKCIIVEDEPASQKVLEHFIRAHESLNLESAFFNASDAFEYLQENKNIDLLFLDINMPGENGMTFYKRLINPPQVIFTTAYAEFAVEGFDLNATDYLLKPIAHSRFIKSID